MAEPLDPVRASRAVLIEVMNVLGLYRDHLALIGGWVPELLLPNCGHMGSIDVDLAVDVRGISQRQYDTILQRLLDAGYTQQSNCFLRAVEGAAAPVKLDLVTGEYVEQASGTPARFQEGALGRLRGVDLAFEACDEIAVSGDMPDGGKNVVRLRIVRIEAFLVMKGLAMADRTKAKDPYDVYFCLKHFAGGPARLASLYPPLLRNGLVREGIAVLSEKFASYDSIGPRRAALVAEENGADRELAQREAFELMRDLLDALGEPRLPR